MPLFNERLNPLFSHIAQHLTAQRGQSLCYANGTTSCAYRGSEGLKCAIGCLINDSQFAFYEVHEGTAANCLPEDLREDLHAEYAPQSVYRDFLHALQVAQRYHDSDSSIDGQRYTDRLDQPELTADGLQALILDDLVGLYITTPY
jgi:hypothetical protein